MRAKVIAPFWATALNGADDFDSLDVIFQSLEAWAKELRIGFGPRGWNLGLEVGIRALRLEYGLE